MPTPDKRRNTREEWTWILPVFSFRSFRARSAVARQAPRPRTIRSARSAAIAGAIGGGIVGQLVGTMVGQAVEGWVGNIAGGAIGGVILTILVGLVRNYTQKA